MDAFVVPGQAAGDYLEILGVAHERIVVAPNAVDPDIFRVEPQARGDGVCRLISVARLSPEKGLDVLLEAVDGLPVGSSSSPAPGRRKGGSGRSRAATSPSSGTSERNALPGVYASADVAVVPSRSEPWGMVINEAALAGLPLISTTAPGGARELVEDGVNGLLVPPDDVGALRAAIVRMAEDATPARSREALARDSGRLHARRLGGSVADLAASLSRR